MDRYESEFFMNVVHGRGIISWAAVDTSRSDSQCDELIGFVTARIVAAADGEVSALNCFTLLYISCGHFINLHYCTIFARSPSIKN